MISAIYLQMVQGKMPTPTGSHMLVKQMRQNVKKGRAYVEGRHLGVHCVTLSILFFVCLKIS